MLMALALAGCSGSGTSPAGDAPSAASTVSPSGSGAEWTVVVDNLELGTSGVGMALHPTRAPIRIAGDADIALEVCPADPVGRPADPRRSSFGRRWSACLPLGGALIALPRTDGASHVGIRVVTADRTAGTVSRLRVRWECADDYFVFQDPGGSAPTPTPRCGPPAPREAR